MSLPTKQYHSAQSLALSTPSTSSRDVQLESQLIARAGGCTAGSGAQFHFNHCNVFGDHTNFHPTANSGPVAGSVTMPPTLHRSLENEPLPTHTSQYHPVSNSGSSPEAASTSFPAPSSSTSDSIPQLINTLLTPNKLNNPENDTCPINLNPCCQTEEQIVSQTVTCENSLHHDKQIASCCISCRFAAYTCTESSDFMSPDLSLKALITHEEADVMLPASDNIAANTVYMTEAVQGSNLRGPFIQYIICNETFKLSCLY